MRRVYLLMRALSLACSAHKFVRTLRQNTLFANVRTAIGSESKLYSHCSCKLFRQTVVLNVVERLLHAAHSVAVWFAVHLLCIHWCELCTRWCKTFASPSICTACARNVRTAISRCVTHDAEAAYAHVESLFQDDRIACMMLVYHMASEVRAPRSALPDLEGHVLVARSHVRHHWEDTWR